MRYLIFFGLLAFGYYHYVSAMDHKAMTLLDNLRSQYTQVIDHPDVVLDKY